MTQLQLLAIAGPIWAAVVVGVVVVITNYRDDQAMKREQAIQAAKQIGEPSVVSSEVELEAALVAVREAMAISPTIIADPTFEISKISDEIHQKIDVMAGLARRTATGASR